MRKLVLIIIVLIITLLTGCTSPVRDDLSNYITTKLPPITHLEKSALEEYHQIITQEDLNYEDLFNSLKDSIIPKYSEFLDELRSITPSTVEVNGIHSLYLKGAEKQLEAFTQFKEGIELRNEEKTTEGNISLQQAKDYISQYQTKLIELAEEHKLKYKLK